MSDISPPRNEQEATSIVDKLFKHYKEARPNNIERNNLAKELEEANSLDVPALISYLSNEDKELRALAAYGIGWTGDDRAFAPLLPLLEDSDQEVRYFAIKAIGFLGKNDKQAIPPLLMALRSEDSYIRIAAAQALEAFDDERVIQALREVLTTDIPQVEEAAKSSLAYLMLKRSPHLRADEESGEGRDFRPSPDS